MNKEDSVNNALPTQEYQSSTVQRRDLINGLAGGLALSVLPNIAFTEGASNMSPVSGNETNRVPGAANPRLKNAWEKYYKSIENARLAMENTSRFRDNPDHRALAYRSLAEAQAMAYNFAVAPRMDHPLFYTRAWYSQLYTLGGTSPDFYYGPLFLDGRKTYKVTGRFGDLRLILMQVFSHLLGHTESKMLGNFDFSTFDLKPDGSFEVVISAKRHKGNWIPLDPHSNYNFIFLRRALADWYLDRGELDIKLLDGPADNRDLDEEALAERLSLATDFLTFLVVKWNVELYDMYLKSNNGEKNALAVIAGSDIASEYVGSPTTSYVWGIYEIGDDEALLIESEIPEAGYWSIQIFDVWQRPFDFIHQQTDTNMNRAVIDSDDKYRAVISLEDPGVANWLDPCGRKEGIIIGRNYHSRATPNQPAVKLVKNAELRKHLPSDTRFVTPKERQQALDYRRRGYLNLYGEL